MERMALMNITKWMFRVANRFLCKIGSHSWDYGPGECCSVCGISDSIVINSKSGRLAIDPKTQESMFYPSNYEPLPEGWRWF